MIINQANISVNTSPESGFPDSLRQNIAGLRSLYPEGRYKSALLPALHFAQAYYGWLSPGTMDRVASLLEIEPIEVYEVASFYSMYHLAPVGRFVLEVCRTSPCCLAGAEKIISYLEQSLEIKVGETTADGVFTLKTVECLAACGTAPVLQIGPSYEYHENLTEKTVIELLDRLRAQHRTEQQNLHLS